MPLPLAAIVEPRAGALIPILWLALLVVVVALALFGASVPRARARWPWLLPELAAAAALLVIHLLFFWQPYRTGALVPRGGGDLASFYYPMYAFSADELQAGRMPFWNPFLFSGEPHFADFQSGVLYPPNLLATLLARPFSYATLEWMTLLHFLLASWGSYWLARALGIARPGAVLSGALYAYSGFLVAHLGHYPIVGVASWLPFVLAAVVGIVRHEHARWPIATLGTLALACMTLAGHQPALLFGLTLTLVLAFFELWRAASDWRRGQPPATVAAGAAWWDVARAWLPPGGWLLSRVIPLALMAALAVGLSAPSLGPSFELAARAVRGRLDYAAASQFSVQPIALLHLVTPTVFGSNPTDYWGVFSNTEVWGYTGVLALALAVFALAARSSRTRVFWALVALVALLYLLGPFSTLHGWFYAYAPGYDRVRAAGRAYQLFDLAVALLAGFALSDLLRRRDAWTPRQWSVLKWGIAALGAALAVVVAVVVPLLASRVLGVDDPSNRPVIALDNVLLLALWLALGLAVAVAIWRGRLAGALLALAVCLVVLLDLFRATAPFNPTTEPILAGFQHDEAVAFLQQRRQEDGPFRIEVVPSNWQPDLAALARLEDIGGLFHWLEIADYRAYLNAATADRGSEAYQALGVRYLIGNEQSAPGPPAPGWQVALRTADGLVIWENPNPRPRAWLDGSDAPVTVEASAPGRLRLRLPAGAGGTLVISQVAYPGWRAEVDGERVPIGTRDGALQQIELPAGARVVELSFRPTRWPLWLAVGALSALGWLALAAWTAMRWRRTRRTVSSAGGV